MKCDINKHIELFKKIPCGNFGAPRLFFDKFRKIKSEDMTATIIFMAYYYIAMEMMDDSDSRFFIVRKNQYPISGYDCHDPITGEQITIEDHKIPKLYNCVIKNYYNRAPKYKKRYGLVPKSKTKNIDNIIEDFRIAAYLYKIQIQNIDIFTGKNLYNIGNNELEHLYNLLKTLYDNSDFKYEQPGSIILAQEMASVMINNNIIKNNLRNPARKEYIHQHKMFMFGEIQR